MSDALASAVAGVGGLNADDADAWDRAGLLPTDLLGKLAADALLCAQVPAAYGGRGLTSADNGELTAHVGSSCSSLRSVMTSQGMAAWTIERFGTPDQRAAFLPRLTGGDIAAAGFSERAAGSDLSAMTTRIRREGDSVVLNGHKVWVTAAHYADLLVLFGRYDESGGTDESDGAGGTYEGRGGGGGGAEAAAVVVPAATPGVRVERVADPLGCRAAGHADITLDGVRVPAANVLGGTALPLPLLVTTALAYGRMSVAWGCVGMLRGCLTAAARHATHRRQFGVPLAEHQLVARHLAELYAAEQTATRVCEHASRCWDDGSPDQVTATVLAKHVSAGNAARGAATAVQVLASAGARDGHVVARAYRDAKLMELIEGSNEMCQLMLARHVVDSAE
ncbi:acyl-CoA dehydrogenase family protein [Streptomyces sp. NPDC041068]|uniref:acyl-CoA dehydrogenase family protein n=1 Tax=Streptomyces sp. NPDC041068 TaxID=3155130 RepID=UPI0033C58DCA